MHAPLVLVLSDSEAQCGSTYNAGLNARSNRRVVQKGILHSPSRVCIKRVCVGLVCTRTREVACVVGLVHGVGRTSPSCSADLISYILHTSVRVSLWAQPQKWCAIAAISCDFARPTRDAPCGAWSCRRCRARVYRYPRAALFLPDLYADISVSTVDSAQWRT